MDGRTGGRADERKPEDLCIDRYYVQRKNFAKAVGQSVFVVVVVVDIYVINAVKVVVIVVVVVFVIHDS